MYQGARWRCAVHGIRLHVYFQQTFRTSSPPAISQQAAIHGDLDLSAPPAAHGSNQGIDPAKS